MNELRHYGIKGMKWGVRKDRQPTGMHKNDRIVIKKGSEVQRITKEKAEINSGKAYISFKDLDNLSYEAQAGEDGLWWTANEDNLGYKVKLKVTNDIIAPSYNETIDAFINIAGRTPIKELTEQVYGNKNDRENSYSSYAKKEYKEKTKQFMKDVSDLSLSEAQEHAYFAYSKALMKSPAAQKTFFDELQKRGYNAVVDHNDARGDIEAPIIVFERSKNLKQISAKPISYNDRDAATERLMLLLEKKMYD